MKIITRCATRDAPSEESVSAGKLDEVRTRFPEKKKHSVTK